MIILFQLLIEIIVYPMMIEIMTHSMFTTKLMPLEIVITQAQELMKAGAMIQQLLAKLTI